MPHCSRVNGNAADGGTMIKLGVARSGAADENADVPSGGGRLRAGVRRLAGKLAFWRFGKKDRSMYKGKRSMHISVRSSVRLEYCVVPGCMSVARLGAFDGVVPSLTASRLDCTV